MKARTKMKTLLLLGVLLFGFTVSAQSQKVSLDFKNERVEKVLASIKSQTGMSLVFSDQLVDVNRKVTMQLKDVTLKEALTRLLSGTDLTFEIRNNKIYFIEKKAVSRPGSKKKRVTGVVKDVMGEPLIGANVVEKGRGTNGVITDFNGKFTLEVDESASLVVSYIGYLAQDIPTKREGRLSYCIERRCQYVGRSGRYRIWRFQEGNLYGICFCSDYRKTGGITCCIRRADD